MTHGPRRTALDRAIESAEPSGIDEGSTAWRVLGDRLGVIADGLDGASNVDWRGETGDSLRRSFTRSADGIRQKAGVVFTGMQALDAAWAAIDRARTDRTAMDHDPEMRMSGSAPTSFQPDPEKTPAENSTARGLHNGEVAAYWDAYNRREAESQRIADQLDRDLVDAGRKMQKIHGEPDPVDDEPRDNTGGGGGGGTTPPGGGRTPYSPSGPGQYDPDGPRSPVPSDPDHPTNDTPDDVPVTPTTPQIGPTESTPSTPSLPAADGSAPISPGGGMGGGGMAAASAGGLGAAGLARLLRGGGGIAGAGQAVRAGSARPIGSTSRAAVSGALGRGSSAAAAGSTARAGGGRAGAAGQSTGKPGGGSRGAAARAAGGRGAGAAGSGRGRGAKDDDKQGQPRDLFDDGQDWIDDGDAVDGVLD